MKLSNLVLATLLVAPMSVMAHGPTPQKVSYMIELEKPAADVWAVVKDFGSLNKWDYYTPKVTLDKKGDEVSRVVMFKDGKNKSTEKLRSVDDATKTIKWEVSETTLPVNDLVITVSVYESGEKSKLEMKGKFYRKYMQNPPIPEGQDDETAIKVMTEYVKNALNSAKENSAVFVSSGNPSAVATPAKEEATVQPAAVAEPVKPVEAAPATPAVDPTKPAETSVAQPENK